MPQIDPLQISPGEQALLAMIDGGYIRLEDLTDDARKDIFRRMLLIDQQAREDVHAAFRLGMKVIYETNPKSAQPQAPGDSERKRGRPKGSSPLIKDDRAIMNEAAVALELAHMESPPKTFGRLTVTRDARDLLRQASRAVMTTSVESTCHRILSRIRKGEITASDFGLASVVFDELVRALQSLSRGFAPRT
jgi:hypothetical protein